MTKQDFELIARVLRDSRALAVDANCVKTIDNLAASLASELRSTNPRFDRARFITACTDVDSHDSAGRKVRYS